VPDHTSRLPVDREDGAAVGAGNLEGVAHAVDYPRDVAADEGTDWKLRLKELGLSRKRRRAASPLAAPPAAVRASTTRLGLDGEECAASLLVAAGLSLLDRNWKCPGGELDLVAAEGGEVVFVEVKRRRSGSHGLAAEAVGPRKQMRILAAARAWLAEHPSDASRSVRFDVVAFDGEPPRASWIRGAFDAS